jgi:uncharacterized membrane protein YgcG
MTAAPLSPPQVVPSVEELTPGSTGACRQFRIEQLPQAPAAGGAPAPAAAGAAAGPSSAAASSRTLMVFEGCPRPLGCTVLLRGGDAGELAKVKRALQLAVLTAYHLVLEGAFLAEEMALAAAALAPPGARAALGGTPAYAPGAGALCVRCVRAGSRCPFRSHGAPPPARCSLPAAAPPAGSTLDELSPQLRAGVAASADSAAADPPRCFALSMSPHTVWWEQDWADCGEEEASSCEGEEGADAGEGGGAEAGFKTPPRASGAAAAAVAAAAVDVGSGSPLVPEGGGEFTDPLRRRTPQSEGGAAPAAGASGGDAGGGGDTGGGGAAAAGQPGGRGRQLQWAPGLRLYDRQRVFLSMACRNPRKQVMCEPPSIKRIDFYCRRWARPRRVGGPAGGRAVWRAVGRGGGRQPEVVRLPRAGLCQTTCHRVEASPGSAPLPPAPRPAAAVT